jgi:hypothetical protein
MQVPPPELEPPEEPDEPEPPVLPEPEPADPPEEPEPPELPEPEPEPALPPPPELPVPVPEPPDPPVLPPDVPPEPEPESDLRPAPEPPAPEPPEPERELEPEAGSELVTGELLPDPELVLPEPEPVAWLTVPEPLDPAEPTEADLAPLTPGSTELVASSPAEPALPRPVSEPGPLAPGVSAAGLPWAAADPPWAEGRERCPVPPLAGRPARPPGGAGTWPDCGAEADGPCTSPPMTGV